MNEIYDPNCKYFIQRNGKKAVWLDRGLLTNINKLAIKYEKTPEQIADYLIRVGVNSIQHKLSNINFDIKNL
jgi:hypothetical protein